MGAAVAKVQIVIQDMYTEKSLKKSLIKHGVRLNDFFYTLNKNPELEQEYTRARTDLVEVLAEEVLEIADESEDPQKARNQIDARKWYASKIKPSVYGDRIDLNVNQVIDIKGALSDARNRVRDVLDITTKLVETATGSKPVEDKGTDSKVDELSLEDILK